MALNSHPSIYFKARALTLPASQGLRTRYKRKPHGPDRTLGAVAAPTPSSPVNCLAGAGAPSSRLMTSLPPRPHTGRGGRTDAVEARRPAAHDVVQVLPLGRHSLGLQGTQRVSAEPRFQQ